MIKLLSIATLVAIIVSCTNQPNTEKAAQQIDSLSYETITMMQSFNGCDKDSGGCTYIEFTYPQFTNARGVLADSLNMLVTNVFANREKNITSPDSVQQDFLATYATFKKEQPEYEMEWFIEQNVTVLNQCAKWIAIECTDYSFTGGAHPNSYLLYSMIEKTTGRKMVLTDFFDSTAILKLTALGETAFRSEKEIPANQTFEDAGYWFEKNRFFLNTNFYLHDGGITFYYNSYEVGPYVMGPTVITIPANKLLGLMKK
ncbi:MAG: DUF3298 domain-containing protein [Bacteroidota bacterium]